MVQVIDIADEDSVNVRVVTSAGVVLVLDIPVRDMDLDHIAPVVLSG